MMTEHSSKRHDSGFLRIIQLVRDVLLDISLSFSIYSKPVEAMCRF